MALLSNNLAPLRYQSLKEDIGWPVLSSKAIATGLNVVPEHARCHMEKSWHQAQVSLSDKQDICDMPTAKAISPTKCSEFFIGGTDACAINHRLTTIRLTEATKPQMRKGWNRFQCDTRAHRKLGSGLPPLKTQSRNEAQPSSEDPNLFWRFRPRSEFGS